MWSLYVNTFDLEVLKLAAICPVEIQAYDVAKLEVVPEWLKGTPTLVDTENKLLYQGSDATDMMKHMFYMQHSDTFKSNNLV